MSSKTVDPILLLRDYTIKGKKVRLEGDELVFGSTKVPLSAPTAWKSGYSDKHYTLGALWLYLINRGEELRKYASEVMKFKVEIISQPDKESVVDYFTGKTDKAGAIDEEFRPQTMFTKYKKQKEGTQKPGPTPEKPSTSPDELAKHVAEEQKGGEKMSERERLLDYLARNEKRVATRHTQLLGPKAILSVTKSVELLGHPRAGP